MTFKNVNASIENQMDRIQNKYQEALTATISHEQMNPLNSIIHFSQYLLKETNEIIETEEIETDSDQDENSQD